MIPVLVLSVLILVLLFIINLRIYEKTVKAFNSIAEMIEVHNKVTGLTVKFYEGFESVPKEDE